MRRELTTEQRLTRLAGFLVLLILLASGAWGLGYLLVLLYEKF